MEELGETDKVEAGGWKGENEESRAPGRLAEGDGWGFIEGTHVGLVVKA